MSPLPPSPSPPPATGVFTYYSLLAGLANLAVDLAYAAIDPKVRYL